MSTVICVEDVSIVPRLLDSLFSVFGSTTVLDTPPAVTALTPLWTVHCAAMRVVCFVTGPLFSIVNKWRIEVQSNHSKVAHSLFPPFFFWLHWSVIGNYHGDFSGDFPVFSFLGCVQ